MTKAILFVFKCTFPTSYNTSGIINKEAKIHASIRDFCYLAVLILYIHSNQETTDKQVTPTLINNVTTPTNTKQCLATTVPDSLNDNCVFKYVKQFYLTNKKQFKISHIHVNVSSIRYKIEPFKEVL